MTLRQLALISLIITASAVASAQDTETYYGLTFVDTPFTVESPVNVVAIDGNGRCANRIELYDGQPFYTPYSFRANEVSYTRTFANTYWQSLYLPYNMSYDDWCDIAEVAALTEVFQYDDDSDGNFERTVLAFETVRSGCLVANAPYIIRPHATGTVTVRSEAATFRPTPDDGGRVGCSAANLVFMLVGTYQDVTVSRYFGEYTLSANAFTLSDGEIAGPGTVYLHVSSNDHGYNPDVTDTLSTNISIQIDGELLGISDIISDAVNNDGIYDMMGRRVNAPTCGLYIMVEGGKTYLRYK